MRKLSVYCFMPILIILFSFSCSSHNKSKPTTTENIEESRKYRIVSFSRIGIAGTCTDDYKTVWKIAAEDDAEIRFMQMIENPGWDSKLYALIGLKLVASDQYEVYRNELGKKDTYILYGGGGCIIQTLPVSAVVEFINEARLPNPNLR